MLPLSVLLMLTLLPSPGEALTEVHHHHHHHHHHHFQGGIFCTYQVLLWVHTLRLSGGNTTNKECNCGEAKERPTHWNRIAGGEKVGVDEFPWIVSLDYKWSKKFICTGALIDSTHMLTAAHCVWGDRDRPSNLRVILAINNKSQIHLQPQHVAVEVVKIDLHPSYKDTFIKDKNGSDVAVLTLAARVQYSYKIKPICLPASPSQDYGNKDAVAAGFGDGEDESGTFDQDELMKKTVTIISDEECVGVEGQVHLSPRVRVHYGLHNVHILCSHVPGTGAAARKGDSGSALNLKENGRFVCR